MLKVGVTGGIGAGKSVVSKIMLCLGVPVYFADDRAKQIMVEDLELIDQIKENFGSAAYSSEGFLDRKYLASQVFNNPEQLKKLNSIVHPAVRMDFQRWLERQNCTYVLEEAALLFETSGYKNLDRTILVTAPESTRLKRVLLRDDHRTKQQVLDIMDRQWKDGEKKKLANFVIKNDDPDPILPEVLKIHKILSKGG